MPSKSRRKKKYTGQRSPQVAASGVAGVEKLTSQPMSAKEPLVRPKPVAPRAQGPMAPSLSAANVGKELRAIAILAGVLLVVLVVLSLILS